jgi:hypothetical protein
MPWQEMSPMDQRRQFATDRPIEASVGSVMPWNRDSAATLAARRHVAIYLHGLPVGVALVDDMVAPGGRASRTPDA